MVDLEQLALRARRTAERSRVRMACRVALVIVPLVVFASIVSRSEPVCGCIGVALFLLAAGLRWRDRSGIDAARIGVMLGLVPAIAALVLRSCGAVPAAQGMFSQTELVCVAAGAIAGIGITIAVARTRGARRRQWIETLLVAGVTTSLGCVGLGVVAIGVALVSILAAATISWIPVAARAS
jgi:hypothetical protein